MGSLGDGVKKGITCRDWYSSSNCRKCQKEVLDKMAERGEAAVEQGKRSESGTSPQYQEDRKRKCQMFLSGHLHRKNWTSCLTR